MVNVVLSINRDTQPKIIEIASIGIAVKKWVSYHGLAVNLSEDPNAFQGIQPCGFQPDVMTSVEKLLGKPIEREVFNQKLFENLGFYLD